MHAPTSKQSPISALPGEIVHARAASKRPAWIPLAKHAAKLCRLHPAILAGVIAALFTAPLCTTPALAATYTVSAANDDGTGGTPYTLSWAIDQANLYPDADIIQLTTNVTMTGVMKKLINSDTTIQDDGTPRTVSCGDSSYRPFFVKSGTVVIDGINVSNCRATGGVNADGGGGGAGLGGALFVYAGNVTVKNATFTANGAVGGGGYSISGVNGGGGGMYGSTTGKGGGGLFAGSSSDTGGAGDATLGDGGNGGTSCTAGGFGGGGGELTYSVIEPTGSYSRVGCAGGFGGGGGGANGLVTNIMIDHTAIAQGGAGGFGGGGGGAYAYSNPAGLAVVNASAGGYGGGNSQAGTSATPLASISSGGGAGFGGAIFVRNGTLTLKSVTFNGNLANTSFGGANGGSGKGGAIFVCTSDLDNDNTAKGAMGSCGGSIDTVNSCGIAFGSGGSANTSTTSDADYFWSNGSGGQLSLASVPSCGPSVSSIAPAGSPAAGATAMDFTVTFSEAVSGVDGSDFTLTATGAAGGTIGTPTTTDNIVWTVPITGISGAGTLRLDLNASGAGISAISNSAAIGAGFSSGTAHNVAIPPTLTTPTTSNVGANQVTLALQSNAGGSGWFTLLAGSGTACGTGTQVKNGQDSGSAVAYRRGSLPLTANTPGSYTVRNLAAGTNYTVCFTADDGTTLQTAPATVNLTTTAAPGPGTTWTSVGSDVSTGRADYTSLAFAPDGTPYVAYMDSNSSNKATVMKYSSGSWAAVGSAGFSTNAAFYTSPAFAPDGAPYLAYQDAITQVAKVMKFNGSSWVAVGGDVSAGPATQISLAFASDGTPYVAYVDVDNGNKATVMKFNGSSWIAVGSAVSADLADYTSLAFAADGTPYLAYKDFSTGVGGRATVMKYESGSWAPVGSAGLSVGAVDYISLAFAPDGAPYLAYKDWGSDTKAVVMKYESGAWAAVGSAVSAAQVYYTSLAFAADGTPYLAYRDDANSYKATVMKYSGGSWAAVGSALSTGTANYTSLVFAPDGAPYVAYKDVANGNKATVMKLLSTYTVTYNGNGATSGSVPTDSGSYAGGASVTVLGNTGALAKTGYTFAGWNTAADGSGSDYAASGSATFTMGSANVTLYAKWTADQTAQTIGAISFTPATLTVNGTTTAGAAATSGLPVGFTSLNTDVCTVSGSTVTGVSAGTCAIAANQAGNSNYSAASQVTQSIMVGKASATVTLGNLSATYDGTAKAATAVTTPVGRTVTFTYDGSAVSPVNSGSYAVVAMIDDANYTGSANGTLVIGKGNQTITFGTAPTVMVGGAGTVSASAASGLAVTFASATPTVCTVDGSTVTGVRTGTCTITAAQAGNANYSSAATVSQDLTVIRNSTSPALAVSALSDGAVTTETTQNISGMVTNPGNLSSLTINGATVQVNPDGSFSYPVQLVAGANTITVVATGKSGDMITDSRTITLDTTAPKLTIIEPPDNKVLIRNYVTVTGTIADLFTSSNTVAKTVAAGAAGMTVTCTVNGSSPQAASITDTTYTCTANLEQGMNTILVSATNSAGKSVQAKRTASYMPVFSLSITDPAADIRTVQGSYLLTGTVADNTTPVTVTVAVDGQTLKTVEVPTNGGNFQQQLTLGDAKVYQVSVTGTDQNSNTLTVQRNIIRTVPKAADGTSTPFTIVDALQALRMAVGIVTPEAAQVLRMDVAPMVNGVSAGDGKIDIEDTVVILRMAVGLIQ